MSKIDRGYVLSNYVSSLTFDDYISKCRDIGGFPFNQSDYNESIPYTAITRLTTDLNIDCGEDGIVQIDLLKNESITWGFILDKKFKVATLHNLIDDYAYTATLSFLPKKQIYNPLRALIWVDSKNEAQLLIVSAAFASHKEYRYKLPITDLDDSLYHSVYNCLENDFTFITDMYKLFGLDDAVINRLLWDRELISFKFKLYYHDTVYKHEAYAITEKEIPYSLHRKLCKLAIIPYNIEYGAFTLFGKPIYTRLTKYKSDIEVPAVRLEIKEPPTHQVYHIPSFPFFSCFDNIFINYADYGSEDAFVCKNTVIGYRKLSLVHCFNTLAMLGFFGENKKLKGYTPFNKL